ncbi:MAG: hypothetical protein QOE48_641 [Mycobacterium sp.]|nr:hypothetical protein [Mycobacterium sp.]
MRLPVTATVLAVALFAPACGSPTEPQPTPTTSPASHGSYASCLVNNGVPTPPAGPAAPPGVDPQTWAKAQQACADKAPGPAS